MKEWLEQEKQKLKQLTRKQKLWYLWDYYRLWIIGGVSLLLVVGFLIGNYIRANRENYIYTIYVHLCRDWTGFGFLSGLCGLLRGGYFAGKRDF